MNYLFPETIFVKQNHHIDQLRHVLSEADEIRDIIQHIAGGAHVEDHIEDLLMEVADLHHSIETFWRILENIRQGTRDHIVALVIQKNTLRDYYA